MDRQSWNMRLTGLLATIVAVAVTGTLPAVAQVPVDASGKPVGTVQLDTTGPNLGGYEAPDLLDAAELGELVGPVALYPDDLLAIVLPASTYPLEIVQAARFLEKHEMDSSLEPDEAWDESVTALLNYPEVLKMMNDDIDWTWRLGDAVVNQQADVIDAVESFRDRAYAAGNLKSDTYQTVSSNDDGIIEIVPVNEEIIYVPYYEPESVVIRQARPVYYYYPRPYPVYYYPYPVGYSFYNDYFWGVTTAYRIGWTSHNLHVHHYSYWGHPYYGHSYYGHYYRRPSVHVYNRWYVNNSVHYSVNRYRDGDYWRPRHYGGARPGTYSSRTRSYRDQDVSRHDTRRESSYSSRRGASSVSANNYSSRPSTDRNSRHDSRQEVRSERQPNTNRQLRDEPIRFRARPESGIENRQDTRASHRTATNRAAPVDTRSSGNRSSTSGNASPLVQVRNTMNNRNVRTEPVATSSNRSRDAVAREPATRPQPAVRREVRERPAPRESSRAESRTEARPAPAERSPERRESRTEARSAPPAGSQGSRESRRENRTAQASVREAQSSRASRKR